LGPAEISKGTNILETCTGRPRRRADKWEDLMKLYEWDFAPNCRRVRMFLLEKGIDIPKEECITSDIILKTSYLASYASFEIRVG
jgi:hypothetical protein